MPEKSVDADQFKKEIAWHLDIALVRHGGQETLRKRVADVPSLLQYLAGWIAGRMEAQRYRHIRTDHNLSQEEIRRIHDAVHQALASG